MSDESKVTKEDIMEQLQAGHRARLDGSVLQNFNKDSVQFREVLPNRQQQQGRPQPAPQAAQQSQQPQQMPESYLNYAAQLLAQMRGVYGASWDQCGSGHHWHGGYNHFYDPCSGADVMPQSYGYPNYDCESNTCCNNNQPLIQPQSINPQPACNCGTATYYDDCAYKLQQLCDQLNRIESMTKEMYMTNQQIFSYIIEYYNASVVNSTSAAANTGDC